MKNNFYFEEDEFVQAIYNIDSTWKQLMASMQNYEKILNDVLVSGINDELIADMLRNYIDEADKYKNELDELYKMLLCGTLPQAIEDVKSADVFVFPEEIMNESKYLLKTMR